MTSTEPPLGEKLASLFPATTPLLLHLAVFGGSILLAGLLGVALMRVRQTTLVYAALWAMAALIVLLVSLTFSLSQATQYLCWCVTFGPGLAILGAKRPQHHGWNAVVVALWGLLVYPVVQSELIHPGEAINLGTIWPWFLMAVLLILPAQFFATRFGWSAFLAAIAQGLYFLPYLPFASIAPQISAWQLRPHAAFGLIVLAALLAEWQFRIKREESLHVADAIWLDFRDSFGIFWGLRFAERINEAAERFGWPVRLEWGGFVLFPPDQSITLAEALDGSLERELRPTLRGLLRRFVDQTWIDAHRLDAPLKQIPPR